MDSQISVYDSPGQDPVDLLADYVQQTDFEDLPSETVDMTKRFILDLIATTIAGSRAPMVREVLDLFDYWGGAREATTAIFGTRLPAHHAVSANVMICHAFELDEFHDAACTHALAPAFWSGLAAAEKSGTCDGKTFLAAVTVAADLMHRLGLATTRMYYLGYHKARLATLASAAAVCKVRGLPQTVLLDALGVAFSQSSGTTQTQPDGALMKRLTPALNAGDGVRAVELAINGVKGHTGLITGDYGLFQVFNGGEHDVATIRRKLGREFLGATSSVKRYPSCRCANGPIEAIIRLRREHEFEPSDVRRVQVFVSEGCMAISGQPFAHKQGSPQVNAQFSIDFNIAVALIHGDVFMQHFEPAALADANVLDLASRVDVSIAPALHGVLSFEPIAVAVELNSGHVMSLEIEHMYGTPHNPMSWDVFIEERLERCIDYSGIGFTGSQKAQLIDAVRGLERMSNVVDLFELIGRR